MLPLKALERVLSMFSKKSIPFQLVSKPDVNRIWKYLRWYANLNVNSKLKKGHNSVKMLHRVTSSCLQIGVMMVNQCANKDSKPYVDGLWLYLRYYKNFYVNSKSIKGHNSVKMLDIVISSCLQVGVLNKSAKFQSHMPMDFENIWGITNTST
jgi:hypothetical protein